MRLVGVPVGGTGMISAWPWTPSAMPELSATPRSLPLAMLAVVQSVDEFARVSTQKPSQRRTQGSCVLSGSVAG